MKIRVRSELKGYLTSAYVFLEGQSIHMTHDGEQMYQSTDSLEVEDALDVTVRVYGLNGTDWMLTVTVSNDGGELCNRKFSRCIENNQTDLLVVTIPLKKVKR